MSRNSKSELYDEIEHLCECDDNEQIFKYMFDYFTIDEIHEFIGYLKERKGC